MTDPGQTAASMNERLEAAYRSIWDDVVTTMDTSRDLSWPQLMHVPPAYSNARLRVVIVGQQPYEWCWDAKLEERNSIDGDMVTHLMREYEHWKLGLVYSKSPFWAAIHQIADSVRAAGETLHESVLWTNIYKIDMRNGPPPQAVREFLISTGILKTELEIAKPHAVVFLTGPDYDWAIRQSLGLEFDGASRELSIVDRDGIKWLRTYHPGYLRRSGNWSIVDRIASDLANDAGGSVPSPESP